MLESILINELLPCFDSSCAMLFFFWSKYPLLELETASRESILLYFDACRVTELSFFDSIILKFCKSLGESTDDLLFGFSGRNRCSKLVCCLFGLIWSESSLRYLLPRRLYLFSLSTFGFLYRLKSIYWVYFSGGCLCLVVSWVLSASTSNWMITSEWFTPLFPYFGLESEYSQSFSVVSSFMKSGSWQRMFSWGLFFRNSSWSSDIAPRSIDS